LYYFTFGIQGQLFEGGWVKVNADNLSDAQTKFTEHYGDKAIRNHYFNYAMAYSEKEFQFTRMSREGNFGAFEHEYLD